MCPGAMMRTARIRSGRGSARNVRRAKRRTALTPPLYRTVALARRADLAPTHAVRAFRDTLLSFLAVLSAGDGFPGDVQVLRRPDTSDDEQAAARPAD